VPAAARAGHEEVEAGDLALDGARQLLQLDLDGGLLPEQHVVLEHDARAAHLDLQLGDELSPDVVGHSGERLVVNGRRERLRQVHSSGSPSCALRVRGLRIRRVGARPCARHGKRDRRRGPPEGVVMEGELAGRRAAEGA
jgi:hypothetical protein